MRKKNSLRIESLLRSEAYSSDGSMKENQSDNALHSSPPDSRVNGGRSSCSEEQTPVKGELKEETENLLYGGGHCRSVLDRVAKFQLLKELKPTFAHVKNT